MFNSIYELPSQVRASLDEHDLGVFLKAYNDCDPTTKEEVKSAMEKAWEACKDLPSSFSFCITASVDMIDRQKEVIDIDSIMKHMDSFLDYGGNIQDEHGDYHVATIWKWEPTVINGKQAVNVWGNVFGGDAVYDKTRQDFVNGKNSLSIAGEADMGHYQCDERGCYVKRNVEQLMEISLCAVPCNPGATLVWYNKGAKLTKSMPTIDLKVEEYTIHKDAQFCPVQAVKKSLLAVGIEAHAKEYGVEVGAENEERIAKSKTLGYVKKGDKLIVQSKKRMGEKAYSNCLRKGYITEEGIVKNRMPKKVFKALNDKGMLRNHNGFYSVKKYLFDDEEESRYIAALIGSQLEMFNDGGEAVMWARDHRSEGEEVILANIGESEMVSYEGEADEFRRFITENPEYRVEHLESLVKSLRKGEVAIIDMKEAIRAVSDAEASDLVEIIRHDEKRQLIVMDSLHAKKWIFQFYNEVPTFDKLIDLLETGRFVDIDYIKKEEF